MIGQKIKKQKKFSDLREPCRGTRDGIQGRYPGTVSR